MHQILYQSYPVEMAKSDIRNDVKTTVEHSGDRYGTENVVFYSDVPLESEEAAHKFISEHDKGWYAGLAVRYYNFDHVEDSAKAREICNRMQDCLDKKRAYAEAHSVKHFKAAFVGCVKCGSKVAKDYIRAERCPVCGNMFRSETTANKLQLFDEKYKELDKKLERERMKQKNKAKVMWLVKFEYHC